MRVIALICFLSLSLLSSYCFSQSYDGLFIQAEGGPSFINVTEVNTVLEDSGYLGFSNSIWGFGFGLEKYSGKWLLGGNFYFLMSQAPGRQQNLIKLATLNYYYGFLKTGYLLYTNENDGKPLFIYPTLGLGIGHTLLRTSPTGLAIYNKYRGTGVLLDIAANLGYFAELQGNGNYSVKFGGSIGYILNIADSQSLDDFAPGQKIPLSPEGFYVRFVLGMGKMR